AIEVAAARLFLQYEATAHLSPAPRSAEELRLAYENHLLWVAVSSVEKTAGFAMARMLDGAAHLEELDVHPDHGRQGIGSSLVRAVCDQARALGIGRVTLTTFRDIPWNAPFYQRLGFRVLREKELPAALRQLVEKEERHGLPREMRVVMQYDTGATD
ncbi:MAG: GNAT family N-acetyltransferase, partial [Blastocatellia bacterium]